MLQNARITSFTVFELLRENQLRGGKITPPPILLLNIGCWLNSFLVRSLEVPLKFSECFTYVTKTNIFLILF